MTNDIKPIFLWAKDNGDANIYDRIIVKIIPYLLKSDIKLTSQNVDEQNEILVSQEIYNLILDTAESLIGKKYKGNS